MTEMKTIMFPGDSEPREIVDAKARADIGDLAKLSTSEKGNLVAAINEAATTGGVTNDQVQSAVDTYLSKSQINGLTSVEKTLILSLFQNATFTADMSAAVTQLEVLWGDHTHSYASEVTTAATCTTAGVRTHTCACGDSYTEEIPATGHSYVDGVCAVCGAADPDAEPEKTLTSISATYSGGDVAVGTTVTALTGVVVTAHYSDGSSETVTGYTLSGEIAEGENTITVAYGGLTTAFTVNSIAEDDPDDAGELMFVYAAPAEWKLNAKTDRMVAGWTTGTLAYKLYDTMPADTVIYPIAIPTDATQITMSHPGLTSAIHLYTINSAGTSYTVNSDSGWLTSDTTAYAIEAGVNTHACIVFKGTSSSIANWDTSTISIGFE